MRIRKKLNEIMRKLGMTRDFRDWASTKLCTRQRKLPSLYRIGNKNRRDKKGVQVIIIELRLRHKRTPDENEPSRKGKLSIGEGDGP